MKASNYPSCINVQFDVYTETDQYLVTKDAHTILTHQTHTFKTHFLWAGGHIGLGMFFFFFSWLCLRGARLNAIPTLLQMAQNKSYYPYTLRKAHKHKTPLRTFGVHTQ